MSTHGSRRPRPARPPYPPGGRVSRARRLFLAGCSNVAGALLAPKIDTAASRLTPGDFALDTKHAALVFRINHLGFSGLPTNTAWIEAEAEFIRQKPD